MTGYVLHLPEEESIVLSGPVSRRLLEAGNGDAALLYIAVLRNKGSIDDEKLRAQLRWPIDRFSGALDSLARQGLIGSPRQRPAAPPPPEVPEARPEYTRADLARVMEEDNEFSDLITAVEGKLGKKLTTPDTAILLGLYDERGLPADVIFLLVGFCMERSAGRRTTLRQIEKEGYLWARKGLMDQESAAAYIRKYQQSREALPRLMRLLRLDGRAPSPTEEKYLLAWTDMGFDSEALETAYDRTILKCGELRWPYMNKILCSWHEKGLHTMAEINAGDRRAPQGGFRGPGTNTKKDGGAAVRDDLARMEKFLQQQRREKEGT